MCIPAPACLAQIFEHLDVLVSTMECGSDEAAQQLELLHAPLLALLRQAGRPQAAVVALSLLATLCEQRPEAAVNLRQQGAVAAVAAFVLNGERDGAEPQTCSEALHPSVAATVQVHLC